MATTRPATDMLAESLVSWAAHALCRTGRAVLLAEVRSRGKP